MKTKEQTPLIGAASYCIYASWATRSFTDLFRVFHCFTAAWWIRFLLSSMPARRDQKLSFLQLHNFHITGSSHCYSLSVWVEFMASIIEKRTMLQLSELIVSLTRGWDWGWLRSTHSTEMRRDPPPPRVSSLSCKQHICWAECDGCEKFWKMSRRLFFCVFLFVFFFCIFRQKCCLIFSVEKKSFWLFGSFQKSSVATCVRQKR